MSTYNPVIQETGQDLEILGANHYNLQVAKAVSSPGGKATFNIVYASKDLEPTMSVAWTTKYGLNWTTNIPNPGAKVICSGSWQACPAGQSFDLSKVGTWKVSENNTNADKNSLNVGSNMYSTAVNIVVGVFDPDTKKWAPVCNKLYAAILGTNQPLRSGSLPTSLSSKGTENTSRERRYRSGSPRASLMRL